MANRESIRVVAASDDPGVVEDLRAVFVPDRSRGGQGRRVSLEDELFGAAVRHADAPDVDLAVFREGGEAVQAVRGALDEERPFPLALIDSRLAAGLDWIQTAEQIRAWDPRVHLIMLAGGCDVHPLDLCDSIPPPDRLYLLQKPFGPLEIQQLVFALSAKWRAEAAWSAGHRPAMVPGIADSRALVAAIQHYPLATMVFDRNDTLLAANPELLRLFPELADSLAAGMTYAEVQSLKAERLLPSDTLIRAQSWLRDRLDWHARGGGCLEQKFAGPRWVLMVERATPHDATYCHYLDVSELKRLDAERAGAAHMTAVAQAFAGLCQRLEPPVARRRLRGEGRIALLRDPEGGPLGDEAPALLRKLRAVAQRLKLEPETADLNRLVAETVQELRESVPAEVTVEVVEGAGLWEVQADKAALATALGELIRNAVEAMEDGGHLVLEIANRRLSREFSATRGVLDAGDYVRVSLSDSGPGMSAELAERAFNPFFTSKADARHEGLGLSVAYGIVRQSGGHLEIDVDQDEGARVDLYLPRSAAADGTLGADVHVVSTKRRSRA